MIYLIPVAVLFNDSASSPWLYRVAPVRVSFRSSNYSQTDSVVTLTLGGML